MSIKQEQILPEFEKLRMSEIKGLRTVHSVTFNPDKAEPGEEIYVTLPKLRPGVCIVPNSFYLTAKFKNKNAKSWFLNNLSRLLVSQFTIKVAGAVAYENTHESLYRLYEDLWLPQEERDNMIETGIANENTRKLMSKDDSATQTASDVLMFNTFGTRVRIKLAQILNNHGVYPPYEMQSDFMYRIKLPPATDIMKAQSSQTVDGYSLEGIELEYETITNDELARRAISSYDIGRSLSYEHVTMMKRSEWLKDSTVINETINLPRRSMKAIVMLFKESATTVTDSEEYIFPKIKNIKITDEGLPNKIFSQGAQPHHLFNEARRFFLKSPYQTMKLQDFFHKKNFALVIDLRTLPDTTVVGAGKKLVNAQSGILIEITKEATAKNVICYTFVVSDGNVNIVNKRLQSLDY